MSLDPLIMTAAEAFCPAPTEGNETTCTEDGSGRGC